MGGLIKDRGQQLLPLAFSVKSIWGSLSWPLWADTSSLELSSEGSEGLGSIFQEEPFVIQLGR